MKKLHAGLAPNSVRLIYATARALLSSAVDDGVIYANPALKLGHQLRLVASPQARSEEIKALDADQLASFLHATKRVAPAFVPMFLTLTLTGIRLGEVLGLRWDDLDFEAGAIHVRRSMAEDGQSATPKSGHSRRVDLSSQLTKTLRRLHMGRAERMKRHRWATMPPWVFSGGSGEPLGPQHVRHVFRRAVKAAGLPEHFTPHCLRHTFASLLLQQGESPQWVQEQLGHASIQLTVDTYGRWLPKRPIRGGVAILDTLIGSKLGAGSPRKSQKGPEMAGNRREPPRIPSYPYSAPYEDLRLKAR